MSELSPHDGIEEAFWRFHRENPRVWDELITLARSLKRRGSTTASVPCSK